MIIDMGLAKFFKNGLSSAVNLGNEAYAAPEILQGNIRDKRSDVWAMGKMIAELCARVRLPTFSVTPIKIKDTLKDSPYCSVVSKMVVTNATERASILRVIGEIRQIGESHEANQGANDGAGAGAGRPHLGLGAQLGALGKGAVDFTAKQKWRPPTPFPPEAKHPEVPIEHKHQSPSPQLEALLPHNPKALANQFLQLSIPCTLPPDGTVVHRRYDDKTGQMEMKHIVVKNGKIVKYEDVKFTK